MSRDYLPSNDRELDDWLTNFGEKLGTYGNLFHLTTTIVDGVVAVAGSFTDGLADYQTKKGSLQQASATKSTRRQTAVDLIRPLVREINNDSAMTDAIRAAMRLNRPESAQTTQGVGPEVPGIFIETSLGWVTVHFGTEPQNERLNTKPSWAKGCNIYRKKAGEDEYRLVAFETSSPYVEQVYGNAADYTYMVRYRGKRSSDEGAESAEVTIAARGAMAA